MIPSKAQRVEKLTHADVDSLSLLDLLVAKSGRSRDWLRRSVFKPTQIDPTRLFRGAQRRRIIERDSDADGTCRCYYCGGGITGVDGDWIFIDHVIPHALGGQTVDDNAVLACSGCNSAKSDRVW